MKLNVTIVSYNSLKTIAEAIAPLASLHKSGYLSVFVVDNHNKDGVEELLEKEFPWVNYISSGANLGFGHGCNLGFSQIDSEYTLFLNPDAIIKSDAIQELINFLDKFPQIAVTAPAILSGKELQRAGMMLTPKMFHSLKTSSEKKIIPHEPPFETNWLCGAILLVRSTVFKQLEGFDERFFLYFEETDLCKRISEAGYELWANGNAVAEHIVGASSNNTGVQKIHGCISDPYYKSRYYFLKKHYGTFRAISHDTTEIFHLFLKAIKHSLQRRNEPWTSLKSRLNSPVFTEPQSVNVNEKQISSIKTTNNTVQIALTFDDAPSINEQNIKFSPERMDIICDILKKHKIKNCMAFVIGKNAIGHEDKLERWLAAGYQLGNHTFSHDYSSTLTDVEFTKTVRDCHSILENVGAFSNSEERWFRFPYLDRGKDVEQMERYKAILTKFGYKIAHASINFYDHKYESAIENAIKSSVTSDFIKVRERYIRSTQSNINYMIKAYNKHFNSEFKHIAYTHFGSISELLLDQILNDLRDKNIDWCSLSSASQCQEYNDFESNNLNGLLLDYKKLSLLNNIKCKIVHITQKLNLFGQKKYGPKWPHY